jgi:hypothetical protein
MAFRNTLGGVALAICIWVSALGHDAKSKSLPPGVLKALASDENAYCGQFLGDRKKGCSHDFRSNLLWLELKIAPSEQAAILVENHNMGACGSAGCSLYLFVQQPNAGFVQVLGTDGETGELTDFKVLQDMTNGHYNLQKTWRDGKKQTLYLWDGQRYSAR